jgi:hypothetical protein
MHLDSPPQPPLCLADFIALLPRGPQLCLAEAIRALNAPQGPIGADPLPLDLSN